MGLVKISSNNNDEIFKYFSIVLTLIKIYQNDFREENLDLVQKEEEIRISIKKEKTDIIDLGELSTFCKNQWKILILKAIDEIKHEINYRKTKGNRFSDILFQVDKIKEDLIDINDYELNWFENTYSSDIKYFWQDTKERMDNEKFSNQQRIKYLIYSFIIAFVFFVIGLLINLSVPKN